MQLAREDLQRPTVAREEFIAKAGTGAVAWEELGLFGEHEREGFLLQLVLCSTVG